MEEKEKTGFVVILDVNQVDKESEDYDHRGTMVTRQIIREVNLFTAVRQFTPLGSQPSLDNIPDAELDRWCEQPITHVWGMGAWKRSPAGREVALMHPDLRKSYSDALPDWNAGDVVGSPYAINEYEPSENLGTPQAFARFRKRLSDRGLGLILDFVPNHMAIDHPWIYSRPERFIHRTDFADTSTPPHGWFAAKTRQGTCWIAHGRDPYYPAWTDTAQLDYRKPETRTALIEELLKIADHCDGVRCDMAMLVLNNIFKKTWGNGEAPQMEFWVQAIDAVRAVKPSFLFIAECYWGTENKLVEMGFDLVYDKDFVTRAFSGNANELRSTLVERRAWGQHRLRFLENHDESRIAFHVPPEWLPVLYGLMWMQPGHILWHEGLETGARIKLPIQLDRRPIEPPLPSVQEFIGKMNTWITEFPFQTACAQMVGVISSGSDDQSFEALVPVLWTSGQNRLLWIGNLSAQMACGRVPLHIVGIAGRKVKLHDRMTDTTYLRDGNELNDEGLFVMLPPNAMHWFDVTIMLNGV